MLLIIIIFLILLFLLKIQKVHLKEKYQNKPKIAVYAYNFGNFRNELNKKGGIDNFKKYDEFDYYFYTDQNIKSNKWNVVKVSLKEKLEHIDAYRATAKYYKWYHIPKELNGYDFILHIDCARLRYLKDITPNYINNIINKNKDISFIGRKHPRLNNIQEESKRVKGREDSKVYVSKWEHKLKKENFNQKKEHIETCVFLRNLKDDNLTKILQEVYNTLMKNKLKRDQLVFNYVLQKNNFNNLSIDNLFSSF